ncbi:peptidase [Streptomyces sp. MS1.AVA.4]|uniref:Peptidase n=1 Tax=Streptomyces pratisoli TaxID=3139917 RepID=A0ACC6QII3_9ACTN
MKLRRALATAVAAAVTTPVVLLSAAPAFADDKPAAQTQNQKAQKDQKDQKPTIEQLKLAVAAAQKAYDDSVVAVDAAMKAVEAVLSDTHPLAVAAAEARKAAEAAATAKTEADKAVVDAQAKLDAAVTDEEKAEAQKALDEATTAAATAAAAKTAADTKAAEAGKARDDARVAAGRELHLAQEAKEKAGKDLDAAKKALADAEAEEGEEGEEGEDCVPEPKFTTVVQGLPEKVVGGTTVDFTLRVKNGTSKPMAEVYPYAAVHAFDTKGLKELDSYLDLEWSTAANPAWEDVDPEMGLFVGSLKAKSSVDVKLRLKVDAKIPAGQGAAFVAGNYVNEDDSCGGTPDVDYYEFEILTKGSNPGKVDDAKGQQGDSNTPTPQGGSSSTSVNGGSESSGSLATTGSSSVMPKVALAGGVALVLGAGAVVVARRRKAGADA